MATRTNTAYWVEKRAQWRIDVQKDGVRKSFYSSTAGRTGQREANAKADRWLDDGIDSKGERIDKLFALWYKDLQETTSAGNCKPLESRWRCWVQPVIGKKKITRLTEQDLQTVINKAYTAGLSRKSLQSIAADMRAFCKWCRRSKLSAFTPEFLQIPTNARYKGKQVLQPDELVKLFSIDTTTLRGRTVPEPLINAYRFAVLTGLRPGELIGLRWDDIQGNAVHVQRAVNVQGETTEGKNQNAVRSFILSEYAQAVLNAQRAACEGTGTVFGIEREGYLYKRWRAYCAANGLAAVSLYELRHTFVSVCKTLPAGEVKELVGHSKSMDTFGTYSHALDGEGETTAQAVNAAFTKLLKMPNK